MKDVQSISALFVDDLTVLQCTSHWDVREEFGVKLYAYWMVM